MPNLLRCLPLAAALAACHAPPDVPEVAGFGGFAVGYRGEVVALGAAAPFPEPVATVVTATDARLVTVRTTLLELSVAVAERFVPALLDAAAAEPTQAPPPAAEAAAPPPGRLQPRPPEAHGGFGLPAASAARGSGALSTMCGVHVEPAALRTAVRELLAQGLARRLGEPEVSCAEGAEATVSCIEHRAFVQRVDLVPSGATAFASDLAVQAVQHGTWLQLAPGRTADGALQLGIRMQLRELVQPVPVAVTRFGRIHVPAVAIQDLRALETVADDDALVLGTMSGQSAGKVVLAIVEVRAGPTGRGARTGP